MSASRHSESSTPQILSMLLRTSTACFIYTVGIKVGSAGPFGISVECSSLLGHVLAMANILGISVEYGSIALVAVMSYHNGNLINDCV